MDVDFKKRLASFGCLFNLDPQVTNSRIKSIEIKLDIELKTDEDSLVETIEKLNFYTWIEYKLGNLKNAKEQNNNVFDMTGERNITALVNKVHLCLTDSDQKSAKKYLNQAEELRDSKEGEKLMNEIVAELAYSLSRLGGDENIKCALDLYTTAVEKEPGVYAWKFGLGLLHRRATHGNVSIQNPSNMSAVAHEKLAYELLKDVANKSPDTGLKARANSQLALLIWQGKCYRVDSALFQDDVKTLVNKALRWGSSDARVLSDCGRILRYEDLNKAIELLEKSSKKKNSSTYHYLGKCYQQKANYNSKKQYTKRKTKSENRKTTTF